MKSRIIELFTREDMKEIANMYIVELISSHTNDTNEERLEHIEKLKQIRDALKDCPEAKFYYDHSIDGIEILEREINTVVIYEDNINTVFVDFYSKPAVLILKHDNITRVTVNGDFIDGNRDYADKLMDWFKQNKKDFEDIVREWQSGNNDFDLIDNELLI